MTDIEMLPLPDELKFMPSSKGIQAHARAVAEHNVKERDAEIEVLRADKLDLKAALESLKAHKENAAMNQAGIIKALTEVRDELGAEIHKLRAELEIAKGQAEFYRTERNKNQRKAERLEAGR